MRAACCLLTLLIAFGTSVTAFGQQNGSSRQGPTIAERFQRFRDSILGDGEAQPQQQRPARPVSPYSKVPPVNARRGSAAQAPEAPPFVQQAPRAVEPRSQQAVPPQAPIVHEMAPPQNVVRSESRPRSSRRRVIEGTTDPNPVSAAARPRRSTPASNIGVSGNPFQNDDVLDELLNAVPEGGIAEAGVPGAGVAASEDLIEAPPIAEARKPAAASDQWSKPGSAAKPETFRERTKTPAVSETLVESRPETNPATTPTPEAPKQRPSADRVLVTRTSPVLNVRTTGPARISVGEEASYTVTIQNSSDVESGEVVVDVEVPIWADVVDAKPSVGSTSTETGDVRRIEWRLPALTNGGHEQLELALVPRASKPLELGVRWTCTPVAAQTIVQVEEPKLEMAIDGPSEVVYGQKEIYKLTLRNPGTGDAENVVIHLLPLTPGDHTVASHKLGTIPAGTSKVVEVELVARQTGQVMIKAEATADANLHAEVAEPVSVLRAGVKIAVSAPERQFAGAPAEYRVRVSNPGNAVANNVVVRVTLPPQAECLSVDGGKLNPERGEVLWTLEPLPAGAERFLTMRLNLAKAGANQVQAVVEGEGGLRDAMVCTTDVQAIADLEMNVVDPARPVAVGEDAIYEVRIRNRGTKDAENVEMLAFFSHGIEPVAVEGGAGELAAGRVTMSPIPRLGAGQEVVYRIKARASEDGRHRFRAEVICKPLDTRLSAEETTLFYAGAIASDADADGVEDVARRPQPMTSEQSIRR